MKTCAYCQSEQSETAGACTACGQPFSDNPPAQPAPDNPESRGQDDDLDFVVTEANGGEHEIVGGYSNKEEPAKPAKPEEADDDLGIQTSFDTGQQDTQPIERQPISGEESGDFAPIGTSAPSLPDDPDDEPSPSPAYARAGGGHGEVHKLSDDEVNTIRKNLYGGGSSSTGEDGRYLSEEEKFNLLKSMEQAAAPNAPASPYADAANRPDMTKPDDTDPDQPAGSGPATDSATASERDTSRSGPPPGPSASSTSSKTAPGGGIGSMAQPQMAQRARGVAYFAKNLIQVKGSQELREGDELIINDRQYVLRKRKVSNGMLIGVVAPVAALALLAIALFFMSGANDSQGDIVGMVLRESGTPYIEGATVTLPEVGKTYTSDGQGFFHFHDLEPGSYEVELNVAGALVARDFATVAGGEVTVVTITAGSEPIAQAEPEPGPTDTRESAGSSQLAQATSPPPARESRPEPNRNDHTAGVRFEGEKQQAVANPDRTARKSQPINPSPAKLRLAADIDAAKLEVDGKVLGAGNLTYADLSPGAHTYVVSADGYETISGRVVLTAGEVTELDISMKPLTRAEKVETMREDDYFFSGSNALAAGDYETAIADLTEAIEADPSHPQAHHARAQAFVLTGDTASAVEDYIRAAEQFRFDKKGRDAVSAYSSALNLMPESLPALLGRAKLHLAMGQDIAATTGFEQIIAINKHETDAYLGLGQARYKQHRYEEAVEHFKDARSLEPRNPEIYEWLMLAYFADTKPNDVEDSYDKFMKYASDTRKQRFKVDSRFDAIRRMVSAGN